MLGPRTPGTLTPTTGHAEVAVLWAGAGEGAAVRATADGYRARAVQVARLGSDPSRVCGLGHRTNSPGLSFLSSRMGARVACTTPGCHRAQARCFKPSVQSRGGQSEIATNVAFILYCVAEFASINEMCYITNFSASPALQGSAFLFSLTFPVEAGVSLLAESSPARPHPQGLWHLLS